MRTYRRARALNKLSRLFLERIHQTNVPDNVSYDTLNRFFQDTQKVFIAIDIDVRNWFPRISPFFIIDRRKFQVIFEKAKATLQNINNFLTKEYVKTKTLEETYQLVDSIQTLEQHLEVLKQQRTRIESENASVAREIADAQQKMSDLKSKGSTGQLSQIGTEIETLSMQVKTDLHHLEKPFIKLQALALHGQGSGLTPEETNKLDQYIANPFEALATDQPEYSLLRQMLQKLSRFMTEDKLKLKPEKTRKAQQLVDNILNKNSLNELQKKCSEAFARKQQLASSSEVAETKSDLSKLQAQVEDLERKKVGIEIERKRAEQSFNGTIEKIRSQKQTIERNTLSFINRKVVIE
jgi:predicted  nucleic acid-binding Zn-ribbon protein